MSMTSMTFNVLDIILQIISGERLLGVMRVHY